MLTVCGAPTVETGPKNKGGEFLEPPILTTPQRSNAWSPSGGVELEGAKKSTYVYLQLKSKQHLLLISIP